MRTALAATTLLSTKPSLSVRASHSLCPNDSFTGSHSDAAYGGYRGAGIWIDDVVRFLEANCKP
jgi:hypothetical protein